MARTSVPVSSPSALKSASLEIVVVHCCCAFLVSCLQLGIVIGHGNVVPDCCFIFLTLVHQFGVGYGILTIFFLLCCPFLHFIVIDSIDEDVPFQEFSNF